MIAVVGTDPNLLETVRQVLDNFDDEHELLGLAEVEARAGRIRAAILCLPILSDAEVEGVATLRARCALLPIFVVTRLNPAAVEAAYKLHGQVALVWTDQVESLPLVLDAHLRKRPFELLFEALRRRPSLSALTLEAVALICVSASVARTVNGVASKLSTDALTLRRHWKAELSRGAGPRETIEWRILLEWVDLAPTKTLDEAAFALRVTPRRIERIAQRRVEMTATEAAAKREPVLALFAEWVSRSFGNTA